MDPSYEGPAGGPCFRSPLRTPTRFVNPTPLLVPFTPFFLSHPLAGTLPFRAHSGTGFPLLNMVQPFPPAISEGSAFSLFGMPPGFL